MRQQVVERRYRVYLDGRPLILIATAPPWNIDKGCEEIGDALYAFDPGVNVRPLREYSVILVFSSIDAYRAFRVLQQTPPAYVSRILPVYYHGEPTPRGAVEAVEFMLDGIGEDARIGLELRVRGGCAEPEVLYDTIRSMFPFLLNEGVGIDYLIRLEVVCPWLLAGYVDDHMDRVSRWRRGHRPLLRDRK